MLCQKCQRDVLDGRSYLFYYGNQVGRVRRGRRIITSYQFGGSEQVFLCHDCVFAAVMQRRAIVYRGWALFFVLGSCLPVILALIHSDSYSAEILWLAAVFGWAFAVSLFLMGQVEKKRTENRDFAGLRESIQVERGSLLAISLRRSDLQARGFNEFFTPNRMKQLRVPLPIMAK